MAYSYDGTERTDSRASGRLIENSGHSILCWRQCSKLTGKPDFVFPHSTGSGLKRAKPVAVFVDGCFWHGCPKHATWPKTNAAFWRRKIEANRTRDRKVTRQLRAKGWRVIRLWEHELVRKNLPRLLHRLRLRCVFKPPGED